MYYSMALERFEYDFLMEHQSEFVEPLKYYWKKKSEKRKEGKKSSMKIQVQACAISKCQNCIKFA